MGITRMTTVAGRPILITAASRGLAFPTRLRPVAVEVAAAPLSWTYCSGYPGSWPDKINHGCHGLGDEVRRSGRSVESGVALEPDLLATLVPLVVAGAAVTLPPVWESRRMLPFGSVSGTCPTMAGSLLDATARVLVALKNIDSARRREKRDERREKRECKSDMSRSSCFHTCMHAQPSRLHSLNPTPTSS